MEEGAEGRVRSSELLCVRAPRSALGRGQRSGQLLLIALLMGTPGDTAATGPGWLCLSTSLSSAKAAFCRERGGAWRRKRGSVVLK